METTASTLSKRQKIIIRAISFAVTITAFVIIPFGVVYGGLGNGWMLLANVLGCLALAVVVIGAIAWIAMRFRSLVQK
jgi:hypothetical protein